MTDTKPPRLNPEAQRKHDEAKAKWSGGVIDAADLKLAENDPRNSLEWRSVRILDEQIDILEKRLYELRFVRETMARHT